MKPTVCIETTIVSYLTAWPSRDILRLSHEILTRQWWSTRRSAFDLYTSDVVEEEASRGDASAAAERLKELAGIPYLEVNPLARELARRFMTGLQLPERARADSIHLGVFAANGMNFLLTWNCAHLANATLAARIESICSEFGVRSPRIITPEMLMEEP